MSRDPSERPVDTAQTRDDLLEFFAGEPEDAPAYSPGRRNDVYLELPKLERERLGHDPPPVIEDHVRASIDLVDAREDCGDFALPGLLWLLCRYPESDLLSADLREEIERTALEYIYWFDEPGRQDMFFSTENHQILFHASELLAGQLFPDRTFTNNGRTGEWHRRRAEERADRWLEWRARFGFSEWHSNVYYDEHLLGLAALAAFAEDESIRERSRALIDVMLFEIAIGTFDSTFGTPHGRTYASSIVDPTGETVEPLAYLFWGEGTYENSLSRAAVVLAASDYRVPAVVQRAALDDPEAFESRERHSLDVEDAIEHGLDPKDPENLMFFWGASVGRHRDVIDTSLEECPVTYYRRYRLFERARRYHVDHGDDEDYEPNPVGTALTEANLYTYRTPAYMLSCAQDFRPGRPGWQQHVWQATLPGRAVVFTTHPGTETVSAGNRPNHWHGNGVHPRAAAHENVLVSIHEFDPDGHPDSLAVLTEDLSYPSRPDFTEVLPYTHGFFPRYAFDEWTRRDGWVCGRKGESYVGLYSLVEPEWAEPDDELVETLRPQGAEEGWSPGPYELRAHGTENAWICELGRRETHGSFEAFVDAVGAAPVEGDTSALTYESPTAGTVEFGWDRPFRVGGEPVQLDEYPRFDNPYCRVPFDSTSYEFRCGDDTLALTFDR